MVGPVCIWVVLLFVPKYIFFVVDEFDRLIKVTWKFKCKRRCNSVIKNVFLVFFVSIFHVDLRRVLI